MKTFFKLALFTVAISAVYTGIAQLLPQLEAHPPAVIEVGPYATIGPEDLSLAGEEVFASECGFCHFDSAGQRCPDLSSMGTLATSRALQRAESTGEDFDDVDYLVEALCQPSASLSEGFDDIMPPQGASLTGGQILAVVAFLQDQGGIATVNGRDTGPLERFGCFPGSDNAPAAVASVEAVGSPDEVFATFGCSACHSLVDGPRGIGPSLHDIGDRLDEGALYEALLDPDATLAPAEPPWPGELMKATLDANGFYQRMTASDYRALVAWLSALGSDDRDSGELEETP